jgi:hypothetical protein
MSDLGPTATPTSSAGHLVLETLNPLDLSTDDLADLAAQLTDLMSASGPSELPVTVRGDEPLGAGNDWIDVLNIILPNAEFIKETIYTAVLTSAVTFMRKRFRRKHESTRPRKINIWRPDGQLVGTLILTDEDAEPQWSEAS